MYSLDECFVCGEPRRTIVCKYNRLIFFDDMWDHDLARYDYALCHGCGLVYATRRPDRAEYEFLYSNFHEFLGRDASKKKFSVPELTQENIDSVDKSFLPWWEVRSAPVKGHPIRKAIRRDLDDALTYLPHILAHVPLEGAKVLHVKAKSSTLADFMKRVMGADKVDVITLFPDHKYLAEKNEGVQAQCALDYENFQIPFEESYNLIIEAHIFLHMLDAHNTFDTFNTHLEEGGCIFIHKELSDDSLFRKRKNLFAELRPFHFQQFDVPTLSRMFRRFGFDVLSLSQREELKSEIVGVARQRSDGQAGFTRIGTRDLKARLKMYARWREESILSLPKERAEALFGDELRRIWARVAARGGLKPIKPGRPAALRYFADCDIGVDQLLIATVKPHLGLLPRLLRRVDHMMQRS